LKLVRKSTPGIHEPILTQRQYSALTGFDPVTTNNLIARDILPVDEVVPGRGRGVRLFTRLRAWEGRIVNESVTHHKMPLADAAKIAEVASRLATKGGWLDHWARALSEGRPFVATYLAVTWGADNCYDAQIIDGNKAGEPDFSSSEVARFLTHPFMVVPLSTLFEDVWKKSMVMLSADQKA
jgi:hypothetical protein